MNTSFWIRLEESLERHESLTTSTNPVLRRVLDGEVSTEFLGSSLAQYSVLPAQISRLLQAAATGTRLWPSVAAELRRNIAEERGALTSGIPHYDLLAFGLERELDLQVRDVVASPDTKRFLDRVYEKVCGQDPSVAAGGAYALEASAVPELRIVAVLLNNLGNQLGRTGTIVDLEERRDERSHAVPRSLNSFMRAHLFVFETQHRTRLAAAVEKHLTAKDAGAFASSFEDVLNAMDDWWSSLACRT